MHTIEIEPVSAEADCQLSLLDLRPRAERWGELGLIPGSVGVPELLDGAPVDLATVGCERLLQELEVADVPPSQVVLVCAGGHRAQRLAARWAGEGGPTVAHLAGGVLGWGAAGLPLVRQGLPTTKTDGELNALRRAVLSCFVAEHAERALDTEPNSAPLDALMDTAQRKAAEVGALEALARTLDRAAYLSRAQGVETARIAENLAHLVGMSL